MWTPNKFGTSGERHCNLSSVTRFKASWDYEVSTSAADTPGHYTADIDPLS